MCEPQGLHLGWVSLQSPSVKVRECLLPKGCCPFPCSLAKRYWEIYKSLFILLLPLHSAAVYSVQEPVYLEETEAMGEIHILIEGHFKMLFIFSPAVNEPRLCNRCFSFLCVFIAPLPQLCRILRLPGLSVCGCLTAVSSWADTAEVTAKSIS